MRGGPARWDMADGSGEPLLQPLLEPEGVRNAWLLKARRRTDLVALGKRSRRFRHALLDVDCEGAAAFRNRLKLAPDRAAALHAAHCGDVIVNQQAKHWNGGVEACLCGHPVETRQHLFWECPR